MNRRFYLAYDNDFARVEPIIPESAFGSSLGSIQVANKYHRAALQAADTLSIAQGTRADFVAELGYPPSTGKPAQPARRFRPRVNRVA